MAHNMRITPPVDTETNEASWASSNIDDLREIGERPGKAVDLVNHDRVFT
jgi:hypothetical protein